MLLEIGNMDQTQIHTHIFLCMCIYVVTKLIKINVKNKATSVSTLILTSYTQPSHINFSQNSIQKLLILSSNLKSENALAFLKHLSIYWTS